MVRMWNMVPEDEKRMIQEAAAARATRKARHKAKKEAKKEANREKKTR